MASCNGPPSASRLSFVPSSPKIQQKMARRTPPVETISTRQLLLLATRNDQDARAIAQTSYSEIQRFREDQGRA